MEPEYVVINKAKLTKQLQELRARPFRGSTSSLAIAECQKVIAALIAETPQLGDTYFLMQQGYSRWEARPTKVRELLLKTEPCFNAMDLQDELDRCASASWGSPLISRDLAALQAECDRRNAEVPDGTK